MGASSMYMAALERYIAIFRNSESNIAVIRSQLLAVRNDSMLSVDSHAVKAIEAQLTVVELALSALANQVNEQWKVQKAKE